MGTANLTAYSYIYIVKRSSEIGVVIFITTCYPY